MTRLLPNAGANLNLQNEKGQTVEDLASRLSGPKADRMRELLSAAPP